MAAITAAMVKELREQTGAGMTDCKKALSETDGNMEEAVEILRKKGQAKAVKKESRIAAEGICCIASDGDTKAAVVEVNSETDFVAKNETFQEFVKAVAEQAVCSSADNVDALLEEAWSEDASKTVKEALVDKIAVIGENTENSIVTASIFAQFVFLCLIFSIAFLLSLHYNECMQQIMVNVPLSLFVLLSPPLCMPLLLYF